MNRKCFSLFSALMIISFLLAACQKPTPTQQITQAPTEAVVQPTAEEAAIEPLYVNILWHQHQPLYYKDADGIYTRPWVRVHATKDYYDMAALVAEYPDVRVTFNLTPVLMRQLDDFVENGAKDLYWVLAEKDAEDLTDEDKTFILARFFDANWTHVIARFPRYQELLELRDGTTDHAIKQAMKKFTAQDYRDLQILFNLAWFDPSLLDQAPLNALVEKERNFSEADKTILFDEVYRVLAETIPLHKQLQDAGNIEVITTPFAHPILPLIYNSELALVGNPTAEMPALFSYPQDAVEHLTRSVAIYQSHFGQAPRGLWPGEGSVAQDVVGLIADAGYNWMATGEPVLAQSLGIGSFTRDASDTVQEADALYRPYYVTDEAGNQVAMFFRDWTISDKLGFTYSGMPGADAAADLMQRLENIRTRLADEGAQGPHIVSIVLDGENAWENYDNDGIEFLSSMYQMLSESKTLKTITPSEYLTLYPEQRQIENLFPGAWFSPNYDTWIGETDERLAWDYLGVVRADLEAFVASGEFDAEALAEAFDFMYLAEGSDWFWWYGADQDSGQDSYFDEGYRALLKGVYTALGQPVPALLDIPIQQPVTTTPTYPNKGLSTITLDGIASEGEWDGGAKYLTPKAADVNGFYVAMDKENIYFRMDINEAAAQTPNIGLYLVSPYAQETYPFVNGTESREQPLKLGLWASHLFEWDGSQLTAFTAGADGWQAAEPIGTAVAGANSVEVGIPFDVFGKLQAGDDLRFVLVAQPADQYIPAAATARIMVPDLGNATLLFEIADPANDDFGPGTYTYPTDSVFGDQIFDVKSMAVSTDGTNLIFKFSFYGGLVNAWGGPNGLSLQTIDLYVDTDPGAGTGARLLLPGRNAALSEGNGWDVAIFTEGWNPAIYAPDAETLAPKTVNVDFRVIVDPDAGTVTLRVPLSVFGEGDPLNWGYVAAVLSQEGYPADGVLRVRDVNEAAEQWRFGGAPAGAKNHTRIIDLIWAEGATPTQAEMLGTFTPSADAVGSLSADDFAQIGLYIPQ